jgi:MFS family permease
VFLAPLGGVLCDRIGNRPLMIAALSMEAVAFAWLALVTHPGVPYPVLLPALLLMGAGLPLFWSPIADASLSAARPHEQGQASGTSIAIRELAIVLGVAALAATFTAHGGYTSPTSFTTGFTAAMWLAAGLTTGGALVALTLPRRRPDHGPAGGLREPFAGQTRTA